MPIKYTISNIKDTNSDIPNINVNMLIIDSFWMDHADFKIQHVE